MPQDTAPVAGEAQAATKTILLVEDDLALGSVLVEALAQETPYQAILATDSHAALPLVRHCTPDLLILDYRLPDLNGIELYNRLHTNEALAVLPRDLDDSQSPCPSTAATPTPAHLLQETLRTGCVARDDRNAPHGTVSDGGNKLVISYGRPVV